MRVYIGHLEIVAVLGHFSVRSLSGNGVKAQIGYVGYIYLNINPRRSVDCGMSAISFIACHPFCTINVCSLVGK